MFPIPIAERHGNAALLGCFLFNFRDLDENDPYLQFDEVYSNLPLNNPYARIGSDPGSNDHYIRDERAAKWREQSNAIMSFLGRELRMLGRSPPMTCRCEELLCEIMDLRNDMVEYAYNRNVDRRKEDAGILVSPDGPASRILDKLEAVLENAYPGTP